MGNNFSLDSVPSNVKWATFGLVPGALIAAGVKGANMLGGSTGGANPLVIGGKAAAVAAAIAFDVETIRSMPLPQDKNASAALGAMTGAAMLGGTAAAWTWLFAEGGTGALSVGRQVGKAGFKAAAVGLVAGAIAGAVYAGKGAAQ